MATCFMGWPFRIKAERPIVNCLDGFFFQIGRLRFVWDEEKALWNRIKHGISFEEAADVFIDPLAQFEDAGSEEEDRSAAIGMTRERQLLFVVHVEREENLVRIISARHADANERKSYENHA